MVTLRQTHAVFASAAVHAAFVLVAFWLARDLPRSAVMQPRSPLTFVPDGTVVRSPSSEVGVSFTAPRAVVAPTVAPVVESTRSPVSSPRPADLARPRSAQPTGNQRPGVASSPRPSSPSRGAPAAVPQVNTNWQFDGDRAASGAVVGSDSREDYHALLFRRLKQAFQKPGTLNRDLVATVELTIELDGTLSRARIFSGSGDVDFDRAVLDAVARTRMPAAGAANAGMLRIPFRSHEASARD